MYLKNAIDFSIETFGEKNKWQKELFIAKLLIILITEYKLVIWSAVFLEL